MARCSQCGSQVHGEYCDACGADVASESEQVSPGAARGQGAPPAPRTGTPGRAVARRGAPAPAAMAWPQRTGALALGAVAIFLAGGVAGYAVARWHLADIAPVAAADAFQPPAVQAGIALDEGTRLLGAGQRQAATTELQKAARLWSQAQEQEPDNLYVQTYAGLTAFYLGDLDQSVQLLDQVLARDPNYLWALFNLAWIRQTTGDLTGAADLYRRYLAAAPAEQSDSFKYIEQPGLIDQQIAAARAALQSLGVPAPAPAQP